MFQPILKLKLCWHACQSQDKFQNVNLKKHANHGPRKKGTITKKKEEIFYTFVHKKENPSQERRNQKRVTLTSLKHGVCLPYFTPGFSQKNCAKYLHHFVLTFMSCVGCSEWFTRSWEAAALRNQKESRCSFIPLPCSYYQWFDAYRMLLL